MTRVFFLKYTDVVDGKYDAQLPAEWKYNSLHAIYYSWVTVGINTILFPTAFARRSVPFPKDVRVKTLHCQLQHKFPIDYTGLTAIAIAFDFSALPDMSALFLYLWRAAAAKTWTKMYSDDGGVHDPVAVMRDYPEEDKRTVAHYARISNALFRRLK